MRFILPLLMILSSARPGVAQELRPISVLVAESKANPQDTKVLNEIAKHDTEAAAQALVARIQGASSPFAARSLRYLSRPETAPPLHALLAHDNTGIRRSALDTLGRLGAAASADVLLAFLKRADSGYEEGRALKALARTATKPEHLDPIFARFGGKRERDARNALLELQEPSLAPVVVPYLKNPEPELRRTAIKVLVALANPKTASALLDTLERDEDHRVQQDALRAVATVATGTDVARMQRILRRWRASKVSEHASDQLSKTIAVVDRYNEHANTLKLFTRDDRKGRNERTKILAELARDARSVDERVAHAAFRSEDEYQRKMAVYLYGRVGTPSAQRRLCEILFDMKDEARVQIAAAEALGNYPNDASVDCLVRGFDRVKVYRHGNKSTLGEDLAKSLRKITGQRIRDTDGEEWKKWWKYRVSDIDGALEALAGASDAGARAFAVTLLVQAKAKDRERVGEALLRAFEEERVSSLRAALAAGLAKLQPPGASTALASGLDGGDAELEAIAQALHDLGDGRGTLELIHRLSGATGTKATRYGAALARITGEAEHTSVRKWRAWWASNAERYRH